MLHRNYRKQVILSITCYLFIRSGYTTAFFWVFIVSVLVKIAYVALNYISIVHLFFFTIIFIYLFSDRNHSLPSSPWKLGACLERTSACSWCHLHSNSNYGFHSFGTFSIRRWSQSNVIIFSIFLGN